MTYEIELYIGSALWVGTDFSSMPSNMSMLLWELKYIIQH